MRQTLLEMVQEILLSMDSDEVDSITDTTESLAVAHLIKQKYIDIITELNLNEHFTLFQLNPSGSNLVPILMTLPTNIDTLEWVKYNKKNLAHPTDDFQPVFFLDLQEFLKRTQSLDTASPIVGTCQIPGRTDSLTFYYTNNTGPQYYTTFDDHNLIFDAYNASVDTTLQKSKTMCYGKGIPTFTFSDSFIPELDNNQFARLFNEAKALAFADLKQTAHAKAESMSRELKILGQSRKENLPGNVPAIQRIFGYGRK